MRRRKCKCIATHRRSHTALDTSHPQRPSPAVRTSSPASLRSHRTKGACPDTRLQACMGTRSLNAWIRNQIQYCSSKGLTSKTVSDSCSACVHDCFGRVFAADLSSECQNRPLHVAPVHPEVQLHEQSFKSGVAQFQQFPAATHPVNGPCSERAGNASEVELQQKASGPLFCFWPFRPQTIDD